MDCISLDTVVKRVWLQGNIALRDASLDEASGCIDYRVPGFGLDLLIRDRRPGGIEAYMIAKTPEGFSRFPESFDFPSRVVIVTQGQAVMIELNESNRLPEYDFLWIATEIEPVIPAWDYVWDAITEADNGKISYIAIVDTRG